MSFSLSPLTLRLVMIAVSLAILLPLAACKSYRLTDGVYTLKMTDDRNRTKQTDVLLTSNGEDIDVAINGKSWVKGKLSGNKLTLKGKDAFGYWDFDGDLVGDNHATGKLIMGSSTEKNDFGTLTFVLAK